MIAEALKYLAELGLRADAPDIVVATPEPPHRYYLKDEDGLTLVEAEPHPPSHVALSLDAIAEKAAEAAKADPNGPSIWYGPNAVVLLLDATRRGRVTLDLKPSDPLTLLAHWKERQPALQQSDLIRSLRITLRDCLGPAGEILSILKRVKFNAGVQTDTEIGHGKTSLGKAITAEVTGTGILPEYIRFNVPVFANPCLKTVRANVECALDPDAATATFRVIPLPGQLEDAMEYATAAIGSDLHARLEGVEIDIHYGKP